MSPKPPVVGFVGLGAMGSRMAVRLLDAGYSLVAYNLTPDRGADLRRAGAGLQLKLVNQLLVSCHVAAAAEAAAMIRRLGLPIRAASEVLNAGWAASAMLNRSLSRLRDERSDTSEATIGGLVEPQQLVAQ